MVSFPSSRSVIGFFIVPELNAIPGAVVAGHIPVSDDVLAVHDGLDQALIARLVHFLPVGEDEVISIPVKRSGAPPASGLSGSVVG